MVIDFVKSLFSEIKLFIPKKIIFNKNIFYLKNQYNFLLILYKNCLKPRQGWLKGKRSLSDKYKNYQL